MGNLRNKIFLQTINETLETARAEFIERYTPKKENRFLTRGITYEIGACQISDGYFVFEISSKIPESILPKSTRLERYFNGVVRIMNKAAKRPVDAKMENIIHNSDKLEFKERDYVKLTYRYSEDELYTYAEVEKRLKYHKSKKIQIPDIPGIATPSGKLVMVLVRESMAKGIRTHIGNLIKANEEVKKVLISSTRRKGKKTVSKPSTKKKSASKKASKPSRAKKPRAKVVAKSVKKSARPAKKKLKKPAAKNKKR